MGHEEELLAIWTWLAELTMPEGLIEDKIACKSLLSMWEGSSYKRIIYTIDQDKGSCS
jgi:hypothetical protein